MARKDVTQSKAIQALEWAYDKAVNGISGLDSAEELADSYRDPSISVYEQASALIRWQNSKAAVSGFVTGLGGLLVLPVSLPANVASVLYVQVRMIAAIAPQYEQKLLAAARLARSRASRSDPLVQRLLSTGTVIGIFTDMRMKCSFYMLEPGAGGSFGYMWHLMDECSVSELAKHHFKNVRAHVAKQRAAATNSLKRSAR